MLIVYTPAVASKRTYVFGDRIALSLKVSNFVANLLVALFLINLVSAHALGCYAFTTAVKYLLL